MIDNVGIAVRLKKTRLAARLSQGAFAAALNISLRSYQNYERGEREISVPAILALYQCFNIGPIWLLTGVVRGDHKGSIARATKLIERGLIVLKELE